MPDTTWPINGHPPDSSRDRFDTPVSMSPVSLSTRLQRFAYARLPDPHLTRHARLFHIAHHSRVTAPAACGGLKPPPAGRLRRANNPSSPAQHHFRKHCLHRTLPSAFRTHRNGDTAIPVARGRPARQRARHLGAVAPTRVRERVMKRFASPGQAQRFLFAFGSIRQHFRPRRHLISAPKWRTEMTNRFAVWNQIITAAAA